MHLYVITVLVSAYDVVLAAKKQLASFTLLHVVQNAGLCMRPEFQRWEKLASIINTHEGATIVKKCMHAHIHTCACMYAYAH